MFAVPKGKGKLEKMSIGTSSIYIAPATAAAPLAISVENWFIMDSGNDVRSGISPEPSFSDFAAKRGQKENTYTEKKGKSV